VGLSIGLSTDNPTHQFFPQEADCCGKMVDFLSSGHAAGDFDTHLLQWKFEGSVQELAHFFLGAWRRGKSCRRCRAPFGYRPVMSRFVGRGRLYVGVDYTY